MEQHAIIEINAPAARVWAILRDVEHWPEWTRSVRSVTLLDGELRVGARARIEQPRIPTTVWTVTQLADGHEFVWEAAGPGTRTVARHGVEPLGSHTCRAALSITQSGWLGVVIGRGYRSLTDRYLAMEATGLKALAEDSGPAAGT